MDPYLLSIMASVSAGLSVFFFTMVLVDFFIYASKTYKEKFIEEAAVELDDVLIQIPPSKILDLSLALSFLSGFLAFAFLALFSDEFSWAKAMFFALAFALVSFPLPRLYLRHKRKMRLIKFNEQLEDALTSMSSALKSGFSINQALDVIAQENRRPISLEFRQLVQEIRLGVSLEDALQSMVDRLHSDDMELVSTAIITARQTGGELTIIFERLAGVIRERTRIQGRIRAITSMGRLQANLVGVMPFILMVILSYMAQDIMSTFFNSIIGIAAISLVCVLVLTGFLIIRKIVTIDI